MSSGQSAPSLPEPLFSTVFEFCLLLGSWPVTLVLGEPSLESVDGAVSGFPYQSHQ